MASCVFERAAQLIGLDDIFKVKKLMGNKGEEVLSHMTGLGSQVKQAFPLDWFKA